MKRKKYRTFGFVMTVLALSVPRFNALAEVNVLAWGDNSSGQCNVPPGLTSVVAISAGYYHNLALKDDGTVVGWGLTGCYSPLPPLTNVVAIAAADDHNLSLKADGTVIAWWGFSTANKWSPPTALADVVAVSAGSYENLALRTDGTIVSWGYNPTRVISVSRVTAISAGGDHSLALIGFSNQIEPVLSISKERVLKITGGEIGARYRLEFTSTIRPANAGTFLRVIVITGNPQFHSDGSAANQSSRFYRLVKVL